MNLKQRYKPAWDPGTKVYSRPLGSPTGPWKRSYVHVPVVPSASAVLSTVRWDRGVPGWGMGLGGVGEGYTGYPASCKVPMRNGTRRQLAAGARGYWDRPRGIWCSAGGDGPVPPFGPGRVPAGPSLYRTLQIPASGPIRTRIHHISCKISQNRIVSPK